MHDGLDTGAAMSGLSAFKLFKAVLQQVARNDEALDRIGPFEDSADDGVPEFTLDRIPGNASRDAV